MAKSLTECPYVTCGPAMSADDFSTTDYHLTLEDALNWQHDHPGFKLYWREHFGECPVKGISVSKYL